MLGEERGRPGEGGGRAEGAKQFDFLKRILNFSYLVIQMASKKRNVIEMEMKFLFFAEKLQKLPRRPFTVTKYLL